VPENLGPGRQVDLKTARAASADSEVRPGPRPLTLRPNPAKTTQARPEAEKQSQKHYPHPPCRLRAVGSGTDWPGVCAQINRFGHNTYWWWGPGNPRATTVVAVTPGPVDDGGDATYLRAVLYQRADRGHAV
jgi:hypothetical protein